MTDQAQPVGDMGELVARLLENAARFEASEFIGDNVTGNDFREAATAIKSLLSNVERLTRALERLCAEVEQEWDGTPALDAAREALSNTTQRAVE
jgi:hypothetical protein